MVISNRSRWTFKYTQVLIDAEASYVSIKCSLCTLPYLNMQLAAASGHGCWLDSVLSFARWLQVLLLPWRQARLSANSKSGQHYRIVVKYIRTRYDTIMIYL